MNKGEIIIHMKRTIVFVLIGFVLILRCSFIKTTKAETTKDISLTTSTIAMSTRLYTEEDKKPSSIDSVIALLLYPHIDKAIQNYFGEPTQFALYDAKVDKIARVGTDFRYQVTITVPTFHGPHNPPYGLEIMTFKIEPSGVTLDNYVHKDI